MARAERESTTQFYGLLLQKRIDIAGLAKRAASVQCREKDQQERAWDERNKENPGERRLDRVDANSPSPTATRTTRTLLSCLLYVPPISIYHCPTIIPAAAAASRQQ